MAKAMRRPRSKKGAREGSRTKAHGSVRKGRQSSPRAAARAGSRSARPKAPKAKAKAPSKHTFTFSHYREEDFRNDGLRNYASYRDLGMSKATQGRLQAHVIRMIPPCNPAEVSKRHFHDVELQMIYVLKGWMKGEYDGQVVTFREGTAWLQPPRILHTVLDYSDDCELLEIIVPAEFDTVEVDNIDVG
jgi:hypothetical protein